MRLLVSPGKDGQVGTNDDIDYPIDLRIDGEEDDIDPDPVD